jgi:hypothetical protein
MMQWSDIILEAEQNRNKCQFVVLVTTSFDADKTTKKEAQDAFLAKIPSSFGKGVGLSDIRIVGGLVNSDDVPVSANQNDVKAAEKLLK